MKSKYWIGSVLFVCCLIALSCKLVTESGEKTRSVSALRLGAGEVMGWVEIGTYETYNAVDYGPLNGGCEKYTKNGLVEGIEQKIEKTGTSNQATLWVMDCGSEANAKKIFGIIDDLNYDKVDAEGFDAAVARINNSSLGGCTAYGHFGKYYFELKFVGYGDKNEANATAVSFLQMYQSKVEKLK